MLSHPKNHQEKPDKDLLSLRTLIIDNYDSYTFNLLQLWDSKESIDNVVVIRNDQFSWYFIEFYNLRDSITLKIVYSVIKQQRLIEFFIL